MLRGVASDSSLWIGSTDFHTHWETATKLEKEIDKDRSGKMFSSEDCLFVFLLLFLSLFSLLMISLHLRFSAAAH